MISVFLCIIITFSNSDVGQSLCVLNWSLNEVHKEPHPSLYYHSLHCPLLHLLHQISKGTAFCFSFTFGKRIWGRTEQKWVSLVWLNSTIMCLWQPALELSPRTAWPSSRYKWNCRMSSRLPSLRTWWKIALKKKRNVLMWLFGSSGGSADQLHFGGAAAVGGVMSQQRNKADHCWHSWSLWVSSWEAFTAPLCHQSKHRFNVCALFFVGNSSATLVTTWSCTIPTESSLWVPWYPWSQRFVYAVFCPPCWCNRMVKCAFWHRSCCDPSRTIREWSPVWMRLVTALRVETTWPSLRFRVWPSSMAASQWRSKSWVRPCSVLEKLMVDLPVLRPLKLSGLFAFRPLHLQHLRHSWLYRLCERRNRLPGQDAQEDHLCKWLSLTGWIVMSKQLHAITMSCFLSRVFYHCLQKSLSSSMSEPEFMMTDFAKFDRPGQLHLGFQAIYAFQKKHSRLPTPWSQVKPHCFVSCKCLAWYCKSVCTDDFLIENNSSPQMWKIISVWISVCSPVTIQPC